MKIVRKLPIPIADDVGSPGLPHSVHFFEERAQLGKHRQHPRRFAGVAFGLGARNLDFVRREVDEMLPSTRFTRSWYWCGRSKCWSKAATLFASSVKPVSRQESESEQARLFEQIGPLKMERLRR